MSKKLLVAPFLIAMLLLTACSLAPSTAKANPLSSEVQTQEAATAIASALNDLQTLEPILTGTPTITATESPTATLTATTLPTQTPTEAATRAPTQVPTQVPQPLLCDQVGFVQDVTIPDNTVFAPGDGFTKTWRLQNSGICSWTTDYQLVFSSGDLMNETSAINLPYTVNPGGTIDISVDLTAPSSDGTYRGNWMLMDPNGTVFGLGASASSPFWVQIIVSGSPAFAVIHANTSVDISDYIGVCPVSLTFSADIFTNDAGTVTYYFQRSNGKKTSEQSLVFDSAGDQIVSNTWTLGASGEQVSGWERIYIDQPNHQQFGAVHFNLDCNVTVTQQPTPTPTLSPTATATPTTMPTATATITPTPTATQSPTATRTPGPTRTSRPTRTAVPMQMPTMKPTFMPTPTL